MSVVGVTPILNVSSVPGSFAWFTSLGWQRSFSWNSTGTIADAADSNEHGEAVFGGVCSGDAAVFLCKDGQGSRGGPLPRHVSHADTGGVWMSWWLSDAAAVNDLYRQATELSYIVPSPPRDEPWGVREFILRHPDGHSMRVGSSTN